MESNETKGSTMLESGFQKGDRVRYKHGGREIGTVVRSAAESRECFPAWNGSRTEVRYGGRPIEQPYTGLLELVTD